jgi:hypothetical protein
MNPNTVTLALPPQVYADLQSLAAKGQADPVEVITRLVALANRQRLTKRAVDKSGADLIEQRDHLAPAVFPAEDLARRLRIVRRLYGIWSEADESAFRQTRQEVWSHVHRPRGLAADSQRRALQANQRSGRDTGG